MHDGNGIGWNGLRAANRRYHHFRRSFLHDGPHGNGSWLHAQETHNWPDADVRESARTDTSFGEQPEQRIETQHQREQARAGENPELDAPRILGSQRLIDPDAQRASGGRSGKEDSGHRGQGRARGGTGNQHDPAQHPNELEPDRALLQDDYQDREPCGQCQIRGLAQCCDDQLGNPAPGRPRRFVGVAWAGSPAGSGGSAGS